MTTGTQPAAATTAAAAPAAPTPGSPEYDKAMADKFDSRTGAQPTQETTPSEPTKILGKFATQDDLIKAYTELEKKLGQGSTPPEGTPPVTPPADNKSKLTVPQDPPSTDDATKAVQNAGLDFAKLSEEFASNGDLKPESYAALEKAGIPKPMVDAYVAGQKALAVQYDAAAFSEAGGEEAYGQMVGWAKTGLGAAEIAAFDAAVSSGDMGRMKFAVAGLKARFEAANGRQGTQVQGTTNAPGIGGYESIEQMKADMRDPRYAKDPAFRKQVETKLAASDHLYTIKQPGTV